MKRILAWSLVILVAVAFSACTFKGTATFHLENNTTHVITAVNFVAVVGGVTDNNAVTMDPGEGKYFFRIEPGTYNIQLTVDGIGTFTAWPNFVFEEGVVSFRAVDDDDLP